MLADAVVRPAIDGPLVEGERKAAQTGRSRNPAGAGAARFLWGLGDPGILAPRAAAGLDNIEFQDLQDFRRRVMRPEHSGWPLRGPEPRPGQQLALMHLGIWGPGVQPPLKGSPRPAAPAAPEPRLLAVLEPGPGTELWAGAVRPDPARPGVDALLPILLTRASRAQFGARDAFRLPPEGRGPLVIMARVPGGPRRPGAGCRRRPGGIADQGFTADDLGCALIQWKAENRPCPCTPRPCCEGRPGAAWTRTWPGRWRR